MSAGRIVHNIIGPFLLVALLLGQHASAQQAPRTIAESPSGLSQSDLDWFRQMLNRRVYPPEDRRKTAVFMLMHWPEAQDDVLSVLSNAEDPGGQLASAQALLEVLPTMQPLPEQFIEPLIAALSAKDEQLRLAAAQALASYAELVLPKLGPLILRPDAQTAESARLAAVGAVERIKQKKSVEILIHALNDQNTQLSARCRLGLENLTGISFAQNNAAWRQWWQKNKDKPLAEWQRLYIDALTSQSLQLQIQAAALREELARQIQARWRNAQDKPELLKQLLDSALAEARSEGLILAQPLARDVFDEPLRAKIRTMIASDSSPRVRALAVALLRDLRDQPAGKIVLARLAEETDPDVRASLANALGYIGGADAVQDLIDLLADPAPIVAGEAAAALGNLGSPGDVSSVKQSIVKALLEGYENTADADGTAKLRGKLLLAMVRVGSTSFRNVFIDALKDRSALSRAAAVEGLRNLPPENRRTKTLAAIRPLLGDPDRGVRLETLRAMEDLAQAEELTNLESRLDPNVETDTPVRNEVWRVITVLLKKADFQTIERWERKTKADNDIERREQVLAIMELKLAETPGSQTKLIEVRELLADTLAQRDRWQAAARKYGQAYELTGPDSPAKLRSQLALKLLGALLRHDDFEQVAEHLAVIADKESASLPQALVQTLEYLEGLMSLVSQAGNGKKLDRLLDMVSRLQNAELPSLAQGPLATRLTLLKSKALDLRRQSDREMIVINVAVLTEAQAAPETLAQARAQINGLGLARAAPVLLAELDRQLSSDNPNKSAPARERVLADLLRGLNNRFSGYELDADLKRRRQVLAQWQELLQNLLKQEPGGTSSS